MCIRCGESVDSRLGKMVFGPFDITIRTWIRNSVIARFTKPGRVLGFPGCEMQSRTQLLFFVFQHYLFVPSHVVYGHDAVLQHRFITRTEAVHFF